MQSMMGTEVLVFSLLCFKEKKKATQLPREDPLFNAIKDTFFCLSDKSNVASISFPVPEGTVQPPVRLSPKVLDVLTSRTSSLSDNGGLYCCLAQRAREWCPCFTALWAQTMAPFHLRQCSPSASGATPLPKHDPTLALCSLLRD